MKAFYSDTFDFPLPENHRFPICKYSRLRERLLEEKVILPEDLLVPQRATDEQLLRAHTNEYLQRVIHGKLTSKEIRRIGFPWSPELVERSRRSVGGSLEACHAAVQDGIAVNLAGGTHHAHPDWGSGFCVFNDVAVAALDLLTQRKVESIVIIDCDVHQGDGTAAIFAAEERVYTFSIHGASNFPFRKTSSDLDIALPDRVADDEYLQALQAGLQQAFQESAPSFAIYLAGADPYYADTFGRLSLTKGGLHRRDEMVFEACRRLDLPVAVVMSGGYAPDIEDIVDIHIETVRQAADYPTLTN
jgi:acetoin utilization deacetylase AcuC-like enzyme